MGRHYKHLQVKDRIKLYKLLYAGIAITAIAKGLGYHRATIYRELERNSCSQGYRPDWASQQASIRHHRPLKIDLNFSECRT